MTFSLRQFLAKLLPSRQPVIQIQFYTRANCHLCQDAKALLANLGQQYSLQIDERDVDADPAWAEQYGDRVPVLVSGGRERFWGRIEPKLLARFLRHESGA